MPIALGVSNPCPALIPDPFCRACHSRALRSRNPCPGGLRPTHSSLIESQSTSRIGALLWIVMSSGPLLSSHARSARLGHLDCHVIWSSPLIACPLICLPWAMAWDTGHCHGIPLEKSMPIALGVLNPALMPDPFLPC